MIWQYLSNTNEIGTIYILQNILQVNKAKKLGAEASCFFWTCSFWEEKAPKAETHPSLESV